MDQESDSALSKLDNCNAILSDAEGKETKRKYKCTQPGCDSVFPRPSRLARHIRQHTGEKPYKCDYPECDKAYTNSSHLKRHRDTHNPTKQTFQCEVCSLTISNQHNLKRHYERVHKRNDRLSCQKCGLTFDKEQKFIEHEAAHAGTVLYKCDKCHRQYITQRAFKKHQRTHESRKDYACTVAECSEVFNKWSLLCHHMKNKHVSEYRCKDCDKVFLNKTHLKSHTVVHSEDRTILTCPYEKCPRFYFFKKNLDHHVRISHTGKKVHCDICKIGLSSKQKLIHHISKIHCSKKKKKSHKKGERDKRKDAGLAKKSMLSKLVGIELPTALEKILLNRKTRIEEDDSSPNPKGGEKSEEEVVERLVQETLMMCNEEDVSRGVCSLPPESTMNRVEADQIIIAPLTRINSFEG